MKNSQVCHDFCQIHVYCRKPFLLSQLLQINVAFFCVCADKKVKINFNRFCSSQNRYEEIEIKKSFLMPGRLVYGVFSEESRTRVKKCTGSSGCMTCKSSPRFNPFHGLQESCFCDRRDRMETNFGIFMEYFKCKIYSK